MSDTAQPPAWRRKRTERRSDQRKRRVDAHAARLRSEAAATGRPLDGAVAEWNILRSVIGRLPQAAQDGEWMQLAVILRQVSTKLAGQRW